MTTKQLDHDQLFKTLLTSFFREFVELFLPTEARAMDFRKVKFLDKEQFTDVHRGRRREMDLVVEVALKKGGSEYVLVHTEFESKKDPGFPQRMFEYYAQLFLRHQKPIIPIAIFVDSARWRKPLSSEFTLGFLSEKYLSFRYHPIKLKNLSALTFLRNQNPISFALMATMQYDKREVIRMKADFLRLIANARINDARRSILFEFVESYMQLTPAKQSTFNHLIETQTDYKEVQNGYRL